MNKLFKNIASNNFRKSILTMMGGVVSAKVIPFITLPILYRLYDEKDFGYLYLFASFTTLLASISTLSYEFSIVLERSLVKAFQLTLIILMILASISVIIGISLWLFFDQIIKISSLGEISEYLWLLPISVFFFGARNIMNYWLNRASAFKRISVGRIFNSASAESVKTSFGYSQQYSGGLIYGFIVGSIMIFIFYFMHFISVSRKIMSKFSFTEAKKLLIKHKKFPRYSLPSAILGNLVNFLYISLFFNYFGGDVAGNIGLSSTYVFGVFSMISVAYSQVFYNEIAPIIDKKILKKFYWKNAKLLGGIAALTIVVVQVLPVGFYVFVLGEKAVNLAPILKILIIWMSMSFVTSSLSFIYAKINAQDKMFYLDFLKLILVPGSIYLSYLMDWDVNTALWLFTLTQFFHYTIALVLVNYLIKIWKPKESI